MEKKYQDYVIKDGRFIGKFEEMYRDCDNPWHQSDNEYVTGSISRNATIGIIKKYGLSSLCEFGCGLGHTTNYIHKNTGIDIIGIDISNTAIEKAKSNYPDINFYADDVININRDIYKAMENILFAEIAWYLLEDNLISKVFDKMMKHYSGNYFINNLVFYNDDRQKYGRDYFTNLDEFIDFCPFEYLGS